jgi:hypothetical protein
MPFIDPPPMADEAAIVRNQPVDASDEDDRRDAIAALPRHEAQDVARGPDAHPIPVAAPDVAPPANAGRREIAPLPRRVARDQAPYPRFIEREHVRQSWLHVAQDTALVFVARNEWNADADRRILHEIVAYMKASTGETPGVSVLQTPIPSQPGRPNHNYVSPVPGAWLVTGIDPKIREFMLQRHVVMIMKHGYVVEPVF